MTVPKFEFCLATADQASEVQAFFARYQDRNVMPRGEEVYERTAASEHNLHSLGFKDWTDPPEWLVEERAPYADQPGESIKYFELPDEPFQSLAQRLLEYRDSGVVIASDGTVKCRVSFNVPILAPDFMHGVERLAAEGFTSSRPR